MSAISVEQTQLDNGLTLIGEINANCYSAALGFFVRTGSRDESKQESGVSHFLEHMMFKGTAKRSALELTYAMGNIGAQSNAYTSDENTVYYASVVPEYFKAMQEIICDMLRPSLDSGEFDTEKKVILEEIALYQDRPQFYLFEHASTHYYGAHPCGNSILGSVESISALTRDQMQAYFDRRYSPQNLVFVASGKFDWQGFVHDSHKYCGHWRDVANGREIKPYPAVEKYHTFKKKNLTQAHILFMTESANAQQIERYAMTMISLILGDSTGSRLYWELIDTGLAEAAGAEGDEKDGAGCMLVHASMEPDKIEQVSERMRKHIQSPRNFTQGELDCAKHKLTSRLVLSGELPLGRSMSLGLEWNYRKELHSLKKAISIINAMKLQDLYAALEKFPLSTWAEYRLVPG